MTRIKLCGLSRKCDIEWANELKPDYIGFVFAKKSRRYVDYEKAKELRAALDKDIESVGVFVNEDIENILYLLNEDIINIVQLHGSEDDEYIARLRRKTNNTIFQAFRIDTIDDIMRANSSKADMVLLDSGQGGTGTSFDWSLLGEMKREYILAGGLDSNNLSMLLSGYQPYGVDVSSGIESDGYKDKGKMTAFVTAVRKG